MTLIFFYFIVIFHLVAIFINIISIPILLFTQPVWLSIPIITFLLNLLYNPSRCIITDCENKLRVKLGKKPIGQFFGHYILSPTRKIIRNRRRPCQKVCLLPVEDRIT